VGVKSSSGEYGIRLPFVGLSDTIGFSAYRPEIKPPLLKENYWFLRGFLAKLGGWWLCEMK
jgi:hypothetical protein